MSELETSTIQFDVTSVKILLLLFRLTSFNINNVQVPWSCAPLSWKWACQRICNVGSYSWEEETRETANLVHLDHCLLGDPDSLLKDNQLWEMAQDRHRWRKLVVDCSAAERWWWWMYTETIILPVLSSAKAPTTSPLQLSHVYNIPFSVKSVIILTFFLCPSLHTRAIAWSSLAGFQSGSNITSLLAPIRFKPQPPALLLSMNTKSPPYSIYM